LSRNRPGAARSVAVFLPAFRGVVDCGDDCPPCPASGIVRGDPSASGGPGLTQGVLILSFLLLGGPALPAAAKKTPAVTRGEWYDQHDAVTGIKRS